MRAILKRLILAFVILSFVKIILSFLISTPTMFGDEYLYSSMARSFFKNFNFITYGLPSHIYGPIYPMILSLAYIFKDMGIVYSVFKILGAFLSSLIIFPVWLLAKEFLNERKASLIAILCGIWPPSFIFSFFVLSENLFFTLFLFTIFFTYKSFVKKDIKWDFLAGLFLGLTFLTKTLSIFLIIAILISFLVYLVIKKDLSQIKKKIILFGISLLVVLPWIIRNGRLFGWSLSGIIGYKAELIKFASSFSISYSLYSILLNLAYLILASGIIIFVFNLLSFKSDNKNLNIYSLICWSSIISFVVFSTFFSTVWSSINILGRQIEICIPLMIILGFASLNLKEHFYKNKLRYSLIFMIIIAASFKLFYTHLFPVNATSLSIAGLINFGLMDLVGNFRILVMTAIFAILPFGLMFVKYISFKKLLYFLVLFFMLTNIVAFGMIYFNSNYRWEPLDQMQLGLWFNKNVDSTNANVLFDDVDSKEIHEYDVDISDVTKIVERPMKPMAFWMNANVRIGDAIYAEDFDYVVSKDNLNYDLLKEVGDFKLYEV